MTRRISTLLLALLMTAGGLWVAAPADAGTTAAAAQHRPRLLVFGSVDEGVQITRPRQVARKLAGAPVSFKRFVRQQVRQVRAHSTCSSKRYVGIGVNRLRTDGFARGGVDDCGGYIAIWKQVDGRWRQIIGTQDIWTCRELRTNGVPSSVVGPDPRCARGAKVVRYRHR